MEHICLYSQAVKTMGFHPIGECSTHSRGAIGVPTPVHIGEVAASML